MAPVLPEPPCCLSIGDLNRPGRVGATEDRKQFLIVVTDAAQKLALDSDRCVQILREAGHLDTTGLSCVVDLGHIPDGLNAAELERYLREHSVGPRAA